jgi:hypothetical protein
MSDFSEQIAQITKKIDSLTIENNLATYDIWTDTEQPTQVDQTNFKESTINLYSCRGFLGDYRCMLTDKYRKKGILNPDQIWKHKMNGNESSKFRLNRVDASTPRNGILMLEAIKNQFTVKHLCIVCNALNKQFVVRVLDPSIMNTVIEHSRTAGRCFRDINNKVMNFRNRKRPFKRVISFHARSSFKMAREKGWITRQEEGIFEVHHDHSNSASMTEGQLIIVNSNSGNVSSSLSSLVFGEFRRKRLRRSFQQYLRVYPRDHDIHLDTTFSV